MKAKDLVNNMFSAIDTCRFDDLKNILASDAVYVRPGYSPCNGIDEILNFYHNVRVIRDGRHAILDFVYDGESAMACGHFVGQKKDGSPVDIEYAEIYRFKDDRIAFRRSYFYMPAV